MASNTTEESKDSEGGVCLFMQNGRTKQSHAAPAPACLHAEAVCAIWRATRPRSRKTPKVVSAYSCKTEERSRAMRHQRLHAKR